MDKRGIQGGDQWKTQSAHEGITRTISVADVGSAAGAVTNPDFFVYTHPADVDVTGAVTSGVMAVAGQIITMLHLGGAAFNLTKGTDYRVLTTYTKDGNDLGNEFYIACPDTNP